MAVFAIALFAFLGGMLAAVLGWLDAPPLELFDARKFMASVIRSIFAGIAFAIVYTYSDSITIIDIFIALLGGAGVDVLGNRTAGAIRAKWGN